MIILSKVLKESNQIKILAIRVAAKRTLDNALLLIREFIKTCDKYSGAIDGFSHVKVIGERTAVHGTKVKKEERAKRLKEKNNIEVDANFFKNKIVCIWDDVVTTGTSFCDYTAKLEQVGARVTNGIFLGKTSYKYVQQ